MGFSFPGGDGGGGSAAMQGQEEATAGPAEAMLREGWECRADRWTQEKWLDPVASERACRG